MAILPDLLQPNLKLVFCGTAPSHKSAAMQAYYAHPGNLFWKTLAEIALVPALQPSDYPQLLNYGIGLTDLNKQQSGVDSELDPDAFDVQALREKILHYQPQLLAFTSKHGASVFFANKNLNYGLQSEHLERTQFWILPSTSGNARPHWKRLKHHWLALGEYWRETLVNR